MTLPIQQWIDDAKQTNIKLAKQRCLKFNDTMFTNNPVPNKTWQEGYAMIVEKFKERPHWLAWSDLEAIIEVLKDEYSENTNKVVCNNRLKRNCDTQK